MARSLKIDDTLGTRHEKGLRLMHRVKALEIQIAAIHDVEGTRLQRQDVEHVDIARLAVRDMDRAGNVGECPERMGAGLPCLEFETYDRIASTVRK